MLGPLPDERLIYRDTAGQIYYPHTDRRGSTVALSRDGQAVDVFTYDEFGASAASGTSGYPYRYTGQRLDPWTGTYHYKAREYAPALGRFLQPDPARFVDGPNVYAYVGHNPWNATDPSGSACFTLNIGSSYCRRSDLYRHLDLRFASQTRFFSAASMNMSFFANFDTLVFSGYVEGNVRGADVLY